ncbi:hypothetical protein NDU88_005490 [Pleurodeles waltl]|uniref:Uncharacterized protein n=1 Tax=Pleurodeles waltl TaxID=8319 RepID=A0AAV7TCF3_PLEWA|nr:hypothetical protein NDU88_005490 [Pleurodeles waltl]
MENVNESGRSQDQFGVGASSALAPLEYKTTSCWVGLTAMCIGRQAEISRRYRILLREEEMAGGRMRNKEEGGKANERRERMKETVQKTRKKGRDELALKETREGRKQRKESKRKPKDRRS